VRVEINRRGSEYNRRTGCGKTARPGLCGGCRVTGIPTTPTKRNMRQVSFISVEDEDPDLILSFAVWHPELDDIRSLILLRTPKYEVFLDEAERGVNVSYEAWMNDQDEMLKRVELHDEMITIITTDRRFDLDISKVNEGEIEEAKKILNRMNFDDRFEMKIV